MDRLAQPVMREVLELLAERGGVCSRPIPFRMTDTLTGLTQVIDMPCGATSAAKCKTCAERNRRLKRQQIKEGWHLTEEPTPAVELPSEEVKAAVGLRCAFVFARDEATREAKWDQVAELNREIDKLDEQLSTMRVRGSLPHPADESKPRRKRSTRRRSDAADLPKAPKSGRTVGKAYRAKDGKVFRPSIFLTVTMPSYGEVHTAARTRRGTLQPCGCGVLHGQQDPLLGTPLDPDSYDYRRQALDMIHAPKVFDRLWQNTRRVVGYDVQYAAAVEMQKRQAPHWHAAVRGTFPRRLLRQIAQATYHQVWWPHFDQPVYSLDKPPVWDEATGSYVDPKTRQPLNTWDQALDELDHPDATPAHLVRMGRIDAKGVTADSKSADRTINYITKYLTKDFLEQVNPTSEAQRAHHQRLQDELAVLPCSPTCANWLLYGLQPKKADKGLTPGHCNGKVHQPRTLGYTGRRMLVSRKWSGKTLSDHRADQKQWLRQILTLADTEDDLPTLDTGRYVYQIAKAEDPDVPSVLVRIMNSIELRKRHRSAIRAVLGPPGSVSARKELHHDNDSHR